MADKDLTIGIKTTGSQQAASEIRRVDDALDNASVSLNSNTGLSGAAVAANDSLQKFETQAGRATVSGSQMGGKVTQVGYQVQDFAVQVASGTSAVRAFSQQAPQLLSAFGPWGVIAGTAVAVAAPLAAALFNVGESAKEAGVKVDDMSEAIAEANRRLIEGISEGLDAQLQEQAKLRQQIGEVAEAERKAAVSTLENDEKIRQAKTAIAEALGLQIDKYKEIQAAADAEAAKRGLESEQAIATAQAEVEKARLARQDAESAVATERQKLAELQSAKEQSEQELNDFYARRAALETTAGQKAGLFDLVKRSEVNAAQRNLDNPIFQSGIKELEDKVAQLETALSGFEGPSGSLREANVKLQEAINSETATANEVAVNIARLEQSLAADDLAARSKEVADLQTQQAKDLAAAVAQIETSTTAGTQAKETIAAAVADGRVTAAESEQLAQASVQLIGQIQAGLATAGTNTTETLALLRTITVREQQTRRELAELRRMIEEAPR